MLRVRIRRAGASRRAPSDPGAPLCRRRRLPWAVPPMAGPTSTSHSSGHPVGSCTLAPEVGHKTRWMQLRARAMLQTRLGDGRSAAESPRPARRTRRPSRRRPQDNKEKEMHPPRPTSSRAGVRARRDNPRAARGAQRGRGDRGHPTRRRRRRGDERRAGGDCCMGLPECSARV